MSETARSGANASTDGTVSRAARAAASYGLSGRSRVGKTWYSGAAANVIPAATRVLLPAAPGLQLHVVAARDERPAEREHREGVAGVAERPEVDPHSALTYATIGMAISASHCRRPSCVQPVAS